MAAKNSTLAASPGSRVFATTRWTVVLRAGGPTSDGSTKALECLCRIYWYPLYSFARRGGASPHDAEDITQSFFVHLLEHNAVAKADRERGRFRSFLLAAFKNFQANAHARESAAKRGGGKAVLSLDGLNAEDRYQHEPQTDLSPERLYDQKWANSLLDLVMQQLRTEYTTLGKDAQFEVLRSAIWGGRRGEAGGYEMLAREVGMSEGAFKVAVHRLRARFRECLHLEVAQTVATPGEIEDELRHLLKALGA